MEILYITHLIFLLVLLSIPLWSTRYLKLGIILVYIVVASWVVFEGCPITNIQQELKGDTFTRNLISKIYPSISRDQANHIIFLAFLTVVVISFIRICSQKL
jgi:hypothetical protein